MKHNFKKILSFFLAALVCLSTFPMAVFAVDTDKPGCPECIGHPNDKVDATGRVNEFATCTEAAGEWYVCTAEHKSTGNGPLEFLVPYENSTAHHSNTEKVTHTTANAATHTADGNIEYWTCTECEKNFSDFPCKTEITGSVVLPANADAHVWGKWEIDFDYVCGGTDGQKSRECTDPACDASETEVIPAQPHIWVEKEIVGGETCMDDGHIIFECDREGCEAEERKYFANGWNHVLVKTEAKGATCESVGEAEYWTCELCGKYFSDAEGKVEINKGDWLGKYGHDFEHKAANDATCTEAGNIEHYECKLCGDKFASNLNDGQNELTNVVIPAKGHSMTAIGEKAPTCTEAGNKAYYSCDVCGKNFWDEKGATEITMVGDDTYVIPALGHDKVWVDGKKATCYEAGIIGHYHCSVCNKNFKDYACTIELESIAATIYVPTQDGKASYDTIGPDDERYGDGHQHSWRLSSVKKATCTQYGYVAWVCNNCDTFTYPVNDPYLISLEPTGHAGMTDAHITAAVPATCQAEGMYAYAQCPDCDWYFWVDANGEILCGENDLYYTAADLAVVNPFVQPKDSKNHAGAAVEFLGQTATCYNDGYGTHTLCMGCMNVWQIVGGEVVNHPFSTLDYTKLDGYTPKHTPVYVEAADADCDSDGNVAHFRCEACDKNYEAVDKDTIKVENDLYVELADVVIAGGHVYGSLIDATYNCGFDGYDAHYFCDVCDTYFTSAKVETTWDDLFVEATGEHASFSTVDAVEYCTTGHPGKAGLEKCDECGFERFIDPHHYTDKDYLTIPGTNEPTCTEIGHYAMKCEFCQTYERTEDGTQIKIYESPKKAHTDYGTPKFTQFKASTCFNAGNEAYYTCNGCAQKFSSAAMLDTDAKAFENGQYKDNWWVIAPAHTQILGFVDIAEHVENCGVVIVKQIKCNDCGYYSKDNGATWQETIYTKDDAHAHSAALVDGKAYQASDCLNVGQRATFVCPDCEKEYIRNDDGTYTLVANGNDVIPVLPHNGQFMPATAATCTTQGWYAWYQVCHNGCNKIYGAKNPNATKAEETEVDTTIVYDLYTLGMIIPVLGHAQTTENTVAATKPHCELDEDVNPFVVKGNDAYYVCDRCGLIFDDGATDSTAVAKTAADFELDHVSHFVEGKRVESTCVEKGYYELSCDCGLVYYQYTAPIGHDLVSMNLSKIEATCSTEGLEEYYFCANCKTSYKDNACTEAWKSYKDLEVDAARLAADNDARIEPTGKHVNIIDGVKVEIVAGCYNGAFVKVVEADGTIRWVENVADRVCDECGQDFHQDHKWVSGHVDQSCTYPESNYKVCAVCHVIDESTRIVIGEKDPTKHGNLIEVVNTDKGVYCDNDAKAHKECALCNKQVGESYALSHNIKEDTEKRIEGTCKQDGTAYFYCTDCNYTTSETLTRPADHDFEGAQWTNVEGLENDYTSDKAEVRYCIYNCGAAEYRAHQDVNFSVEIDSAIKAGAALVNSGKLAVTVKMSAYQLKANYFTFSFEYSNNLIFDSVVFSDTAKAFGQCDAGTKVENGANVFTLNTFRFAATDFDINGQDLVYATVYFIIADDAYGTKAEIENLKVSEIAKVDGTSVEATVGAAVADDVLMLGDMNNDGSITAADMRLIANLAASNGYDARADVDKTGTIMPVDVTATQKYVVGAYDYAQLIHPENR